MSISLGKHACPCTNTNMYFGSWNVEGMTDLKLCQLCDIMRARSLAILCVQETRATCTGCRTLDNGYVFITSSGKDNEKNYAGVGFLIAPYMRKSIFSFKLVSDRICYIKLRVKDAPHNNHDYGFRQHFFTDLAGVVANSRSYGQQLVVGDFNARIHNKIGGEDGIFGDFCFGNNEYSPQQRPNANRELLLELCLETNMCVANTFIANEADNLATFHDVWQNPVSEITHKGFAQLDLVLCERTHLCKVLQTRSDRWQTLASHHFLLEATIKVTVEQGSCLERKTKQERRKLNLEELRDRETAVKFANRFADLASKSNDTGNSVGEVAEALCEQLHAAARDTLPTREVQPARPWIRDDTLSLIAERNNARRAGDRDLEAALNKSIRRSARADRCHWVTNIITAGSFDEVKQLKRQQKVRVESRKLRDADGLLVESRERAETFAQHLERIQWAVRPMNAFTERPPLAA